MPTKTSTRLKSEKIMKDYEVERRVEAAKSKAQAHRNKYQRFWNLYLGLFGALQVLFFVLILMKPDRTPIEILLPINMVVWTFWVWLLQTEILRLHYVLDMMYSIRDIESDILDGMTGKGKEK